MKAVLLNVDYLSLKLPVAVEHPFVADGFVLAGIGFGLGDIVVWHWIRDTQ